MKFEIPEPMKIEHEELHAVLAEATKAGGRTGEAAQAVAKVLHRSACSCVCRKENSTRT